MAWTSRFSQIVFSESGGGIGRRLRAGTAFALHRIPGFLHVVLRALEYRIARVHDVRVDLASPRTIIYMKMRDRENTSLPETIGAIADFANLLGQIPQGFTLINRLFDESGGIDPFVQGFRAYREGVALEETLRDAWAQETIPTQSAERILRRFLASHPNYALQNLRHWTHLSEDFVIRKQRIFEALEGEEGRLLDLGCSYNPWVDEYATRSGFVGLDLSLMSLRAGNVLNPINRGHLVNGDVRYLPFRDAGFRAVVSSEVLEHVPHPVLVIREINRILQNRGVAVLSVPMHVVDRIDLGEQDPTHRGDFFTFDELCETFMQCGFDIEDVKKNPYYIFKLRKHGD